MQLITQGTPEKGFKAVRKGHKAPSKLRQGLGGVTCAESGSENTNGGPPPLILKKQDGQTRATAWPTSPRAHPTAWGATVASDRLREAFFTVSPAESRRQNGSHGVGPGP